MYPSDVESFEKERVALSIAHYKFYPDHWIYRGETGNDFGRDCLFELTENGECLNHRLECQVKGRSKIMIVDSGKFISFPLDVKTIKYALNSANSFMLLLVDLVTENIYYLCLQEYFNNNDILRENETRKQINVRIPIENALNYGDEKLQAFAKNHW